MSPRPQPTSDLRLPDEAARRQWFSREILPHEPALRAWLRSRYPTLADDDDIVQEAYFRLLKTQPAAVENPKSYLFSTARNLVLDLFRRQRSGPLTPAAEDLDQHVRDDTDTPETVCAQQEYALLREAIAALPPRCRAIMERQKLQGYSNREIAEELGLSINTVNAQLVLGLAKCRQYLATRGVFARRHSHG